VNKAYWLEFAILGHNEIIPAEARLAGFAVIATHLKHPVVLACKAFSSNYTATEHNIPLWFRLINAVIKLVGNNYLDVNAYFVTSAQVVERGG
jgi:hypothetical protein